MEFTAYSVTYVKVINVAGGGLGNGNAYANIEIEFKDSDMNEISRVFYAEYGRNPSRRWIGVDIDWDDDGTSFNVIDENGDVVNSSGKAIISDDEDEEDEEDEDEEDEEGTDDEKSLTHQRKNVSGTCVSR